MPWSLRPLALRGARVVAVAIALTYAAVAAMDEQFRALVLTDVTCAVDRIPLGVKHLSCAIRAAFADSPAVRMRNYVLSWLGHDVYQ